MNFAPKGETLEDGKVLGEQPRRRRQGRLVYDVESDILVQREVWLHVLEDFPRSTSFTRYLCAQSTSALNARKYCDGHGSLTALLFEQAQRVEEWRWVIREIDLNMGPVLRLQLQDIEPNLAHGRHVERKTSSVCCSGRVSSRLFIDVQEDYK